MKNFRGFEDATLSLDRPLTVLFGVNGSGKSSVLAACAILLSRVFLEAYRPELFSEERIWHHEVEDTDLRWGEDKLSLQATLRNGDVTRQVAVIHPDPLPGVKYPDATLQQLHGRAPALSVFYQASRDVAFARDAFTTPANGGKTPSVYASSSMYDALAVGSLKFRSLFQWFKGREDVENELKVARQNLTLEDPQLAAVRRAVAGMLPGFSGLRVQRDPLHMVIRKGDTTLVIDQLSDGEKLLLALTAADLARRLAMTYPDSPDPLQGEAVVLIDEIELHLHPSWQRRVLALFRSTFPNCQFIVTTHSPQVLSEVPNDAVVLVEDFQFVRPGAPTAGRDCNAILAEVMNTPERPAPQLGAIRAISILLDEGKHAEARAEDRRSRAGAQRTQSRGRGPAHDAPLPGGRR